jgi:hypothetical protein
VSQLLLRLIGPEIREQSLRQDLCYKAAMRKQSKPMPLTRSERKAAETDRWVKNHLATARKAEDLKNSQLRILRLARDAYQKPPLS